MRAPLGVPKARLLASLLSLLVVLCVAGCGETDTEDEATRNGQPAETIPYQDDLSADSTPLEVARRLIRALDKDDLATLEGLVAVKAEARDVQSLYAKYGREAGLQQAVKPARIARMTATGWQLTYAFFRPGETTVEEASVDGRQAVVYARGTRRDGRTASLRIEMVRENGLWKIRAGLKEG